MSEAMAISRSALDVEWQRLQVIAQNLANLNTARTASGAPYRAMRVVSGPALRGAGSKTVEGTTGTAGRAGATGFADALARRGAAVVEVYGIEAVPGSRRRVYDPGDPAAGADGFVDVPNIDQAGEMALMIRTSRSYEANLTALAIERQMFSRALDLGRGS